MQLLWHLQETEQEISRREKELQNIPSVAAYQEKKKALLEREEENSRKEEEERAVQKELSRREHHLLSVAASLQEAQQKLYSGEVPSVKELENLEKKVQATRREKQQLEDAVLSLMETAENLEAELTLLRQRRREQEEDVQAARARARRDYRQAQRELEALQEKRARLEARIEPGLLARYRELSRGGRRCISAVKDNFCGICNVSLPSSFRAYLFTPGKQVHCENCGSLLVLLEEGS